MGVGDPSSKRDFAGLAKFFVILKASSSDLHLYHQPFQTFTTVCFQDKRYFHSMILLSQSMQDHEERSGAPVLLLILTKAEFSHLFPRSFLFLYF